MVDLSDRGHGRILPPSAEALLNSYRWGDAGEEVHVGTGHDLEELTRIGREAVDVTPLPFGVDNVKGQ